MHEALMNINTTYRNIFIENPNIEYIQTDKLKPIRSRNQQASKKKKIK
jgi:hypothetical protein